MLLLGTKDENVIEHVQGEIGHKYLHNVIQNELLDLIATHTLRKVVSKIREMMADEGTDVSKVEQLSFCVRSVNADLNVNEDFLGFYEITNIKSDTIVNAIKDILLRCHLSLDDCRGQTYDGASNMIVKRSGVSTQIKSEQPKAATVHCQGHSLNLAIKSLTKECDILNKTMGTVGQICVLVKFSPKREKMLGEIKEDIEGEFEDDIGQKKEKLDKLSVTRWTVLERSSTTTLHCNNFGKNP